MFVYIIGNAEQNIFKLEVAGDPFRQLAEAQAGNPHKLSVLCKIGVQNKNVAALVQQLGRKELSQYEGAGEWFLNVPEYLLAQLENGHYLRAIAGKAGVEIIDQKAASSTAGKGGLHRLTPKAQHSGLTFEEILEKVEQAYDQGVPIDKMMQL